MVAGGLGVMLPRMAVDAGRAAWADVELRPMAGGSAWRTVGLTWRRRSPRADEYRALTRLVEPPA